MKNLFFIIILVLSLNSCSNNKEHKKDFKEPQKTTIDSTDDDLYWGLMMDND